MKRLARLGGALYLVIIAIGLWGELFVRDRIIVGGNPAVTAANIRAHETLWRVHIAAEIVLLICAIAVLAILYALLRDVNRELAILAVMLNLVSIAIEAIGALSLIQAVFPFGDVFTMAAVRTHANAFGVSLIFFGCFCLVIGYLIFRSGLFPKAIGVLMQIAGACYLINSFALIVSPALARNLFPAILGPSFICELTFALYLTIKGVRSGHV